jgi:hypothetical protein
VSPIPNEVNIEITSTDLSGPGFAGALANIVKLRAAAAALGKDIGNITFNADPGKMTMALQMLKSRLQSMGIADIADVNIPIGKISTQLMILKRLINQAGISDLLDVNVSDASLAEQMAKIHALSGTVNVEAQGEGFGGITAQLVALKALGGSIPIGENISISGGAQLAATTAALNAMIKAGEQVPWVFEGVGGSLKNLDTPLANFSTIMSIINGDMMASARNALNAGAAFDTMWNAAATMNDVFDDSIRDTANLRNTMYDVTASLAAGNNAVRAAIPLVNGFGWGWGLLTGHVQLFGGALTQIGIPSIIATASGLHILTDGIIEIAATLIPAAIAFTAFGVGAIDTVMEITSHIQDLDKANDELGGTIYPLTGGFTKLAAAVQPEVYTLFGEGLIFINHNAGMFTTLAVGAGKVLDDLGARFVYATTQGKGFGTIMQHGVADLAGWGDLIGNIGGIIGALLNDMPGYAEVLLSLSDDVSGFAERLVMSSGTLIKWGIAAHGAILYGGLLGTAVTYVARQGFTLLSNTAMAAAGGLETLGLEGTAVAGALRSTGVFAAGLSALPWGWIGIAVAGFIALDVALNSIKNQAQQFNANMQQMIQNAKLVQLPTLISTAQIATGQRYVDTMSQLNAAQDQYGRGVSRSAALNEDQVVQYQSLTDNANAYRQGMQQLDQQDNLVIGRIGQMATKFGGAASAMALMNAAGITSAQITSTNNQTWAEAVIEIQAQADAMRALFGDTGRYAAALNALSGPEQYLGDMLHSIQNVAAAQDAMIQNMTQGQTSLVAFEQGIAGIGTDAKKSGASLNGLGANSLTLTGDFYNNFTAAQKVIDALEEQEASTGQLTTATATISGQMLTYAGSNVAARGTIVAMINDALGPGTVSLKTLNTWVKNNSTSLGGLNSIIEQSTIKAGQLSNVLQNDLTAQFHADLLASSGATGQMKLFTQAIVDGGTNTQNFHNVRAQLIEDLIKTGLSATQAKQYVNNLQNQIDAMHGKNVSIGVAAQGRWDIKEVAGLNIGQMLSGIGSVSGAGASGGAKVPGYGGGDVWPYLLEGGEAVVSKDKARKYSKLLAMMGVPGFSAGGVAGFGPVGGLGSQVSGMVMNDVLNADKNAALSAALSAAHSAAVAARNRALAAQAARALQGTTGGVMSGGQIAALWDAVGGPGYAADNMARIAYAESGGDPSIVQAGEPPGLTGWGLYQITPTSGINQNGAYGNLLNATNNTRAALDLFRYSGYEPWASDPVGGGLVGSGLSYDQGGWLPTGRSVAYNGTGHPEWVGGSPTVDIVLHMDASFAKATGLTPQQIKNIKYTVRTQGGGDVQKAFGNG